MGRFKVTHLTHDQVYSDPALVSRLRFLTNGGWGRAKVGSAMLDDLHSKRKGHFFLIRKSWNNVVHGWAFVTERARPFGHDEPLYQVAIYVSAKMRRQGFGKALMSEVLSFFPAKNLVCCPWTPAGRKLFDSFKLKVEEDWCMAYGYCDDI